MNKDGIIDILENKIKVLENQITEVVRQNTELKTGETLKRARPGRRPTEQVEMPEPEIIKNGIKAARSDLMNVYNHLSFSEILDKKMICNAIHIVMSDLNQLATRIK